MGTAAKANKWGPDKDGIKKCLTDGRTKVLSLCGVSADVFLGKFEDNSYLADARAAYGINPALPPVHPGKPDRIVPKPQPITKRDVDKKKIKELSMDLCGDKDWYDYFQGLAADCGLPMDADAMNDEQVEHIIAELDGMNAQRKLELASAGSGQTTLGIPDGPPLSAYDDDDMPF